MSHRIVKALSEYSKYRVIKYNAFNELPCCLLEQVKNRAYLLYTVTVVVLVCQSIKCEVNEIRYMNR